MKYAVILFLVVAVCACARDSGSSVVDTVLQDFGLQERPEGYVSNADRVFERLDEVGIAEIQRLNAENRFGEVKYDDTDPVHGRYYKAVKVYENYHPLDAAPASRNAGAERGGYVAYIEFTYRVHQSTRTSSKTEAASASATIPTADRGNETRRYNFNSGGHWLGGEGELVRR